MAESTVVETEAVFLTHTEILQAVTAAAVAKLGPHVAKLGPHVALDYHLDLRVRVKDGRATFFAFAIFKPSDG